MFKKEEKKEVLRKYVVTFCHEVYEYDILEEARECCDIFGYDYSEIHQMF